MANCSICSFPCSSTLNCRCTTDHKDCFCTGHLFFQKILVSAQALSSMIPRIGSFQHCLTFAWYNAVCNRRQGFVNCALNKDSIFVYLSDQQRFNKSW